MILFIFLVAAIVVTNFATKVIAQETYCESLMVKLEPDFARLENQIVQCESTGCDKATIQSIKEQFLDLEDQMGACATVLANQM